MAAWVTENFVRLGRFTLQRMVRATEPESRIWRHLSSGGWNRHRLGQLHQRMDAAIRGHAYVQSDIDRDLLGRVTDRPVCTLLTGHYGNDLVLCRAISQEDPDATAEKVAGYRGEVYRRFQLKVGGDPHVDIEPIKSVREVLEPTDKLVEDTNTGCLMHEAARVVRALEGSWKGDIITAAIIFCNRRSS